MDLTMQLFRTPKGQQEIYSHSHALRPRHRQILFSLGQGLTLFELRAKLPNCVDLEERIEELLQHGFIQALRAAQPQTLAHSQHAG